MAARTRITPKCASCDHYDGLSDSCRYPLAGCSRRRGNPGAAKYADPCRKCEYLNRRSQECAYPGLGCVQWKEGNPHEKDR